MAQHQRRFGYSQILGLVALISFGQACQYEPDGAYRNELDPVPLPVVSISLANIEQDTIAINEDLSIQYRLSFEGRRLYAYRISTKEWTLEEQFYDFTQRPANQLLGTIVLSAADLAVQEDELRIEMAYSSGNGSLADIAATDVLEQERKWILVTE